MTYKRKERKYFLCHVLSIYYRRTTYTIGIPTFMMDEVKWFTIRWDKYDIWILNVSLKSFIVLIKEKKKRAEKIKIINKTCVNLTNKNVFA